MDRHPNPIVYLLIETNIIIQTLKKKNTSLLKYKLIAVGFTHTWGPWSYCFDENGGNAAWPICDGCTKRHSL